MWIGCVSPLRLPLNHYSKVSRVCATHIRPPKRLIACKPPIEQLARWNPSTGVVNQERRRGSPGKNIGKKKMIRE